MTAFPFPLGWRPLAVLCQVALMAVCGMPQAAAQYPDRPVRIVTPFPVGSGVDVNLRMVTERLSKAWGKPVLVENKPGAAGFIAIEAARRAPADGYTLLQLDSAQMAAQPYLFSKLPYDLKRDFTPVTTLFRNYFFLAVPADSRYRSVGELIADAKAAPGNINYGSWFVGSPGHLGGAMLDQAAGTSMTHIAYKEMSQLYTAVASSQVPWAFGTIGSMNALYKGGKLRLLAAAAPARVRGFESVPTMGEAGGPQGFELSAWVGILAPRGVPDAIAARIRRDIATALQDPELRERYMQLAYEPLAMTPEQFQAQLDADSRRYGQIIKRLNISLD
ncbi:tripartite tricarboxylate transporter substrate binding protein [Pigmentiphaga sp. H8]|uniref:Bug family tripartite tricarboxylate transporter substrate binding protein n=1 Tax=Pigmentiphaga sp. H8 TaxID=2488560 RepID=UPI000F599747|nr:tripartite tricarboxylate transporter substrate binding protein [Pigmentiphaga sp. H8]AZG07384.1 tripartite tricarboxylate transporter substrate binding protein [Pigmentiphaga sp. H8]